MSTAAIEIPDRPTVAKAREQMLGLCDALGRKYHERSHLVRDLAITAIAQQHMLILGPPGTAKSAMVNDFAAALSLRSFTRILGKTSEPNELFGPWSLPALKDGRYERCIEGYLPTAEVVFIDEIFKANSAILNTLLTAINERLFDQGAGRIKIPLRMMVGASNEGPQDEILRALYDRFLVRHQVDYLSSTSSFEALLDDEIEHEIPTLSEHTLTVLSDAAKGVDLAKVKPLLVQLWHELNTNCGLRPSDRRYRESLKLIRASAVLHGRTTATASDLRILVAVLWDNPEDQPTVQDLLLRLRSPALTQLAAIRDAAREKFSAIGDLAKLSVRDASSLGQTHIDLQRMTREVGKQLAKLDADDKDEALAIQSEVDGMERKLQETLSRVICSGTPI